MEDDVLLFKVVNNTLIIYHNNTDEWQGAGYTYIADQVNTFLKAYDIEPTYIDPNYTYGYFDEVNGNWTGMIGHVSLASMKMLLRKSLLSQIIVD